METKSIYKSKTYWYNKATVVLAVLMALATHYGVEPDAQVLEMTTATLLGITPVINIILRLVTKQPVKL